MKTEQQAIEEIISKPKYYLYANPPMNQSTASNFVSSYRKGMAKKKTINNFLETFGYVISTPETWVKQLEGKPSNLKTK